MKFLKWCTLFGFVLLLMSCSVDSNKIKSAMAGKHYIVECVYGSVYITRYISQKHTHSVFNEAVKPNGEVWSCEDFEKEFGEGELVK